MNDRNPVSKGKSRTSEQQARLAKGCLSLFALPFVGFGIFAVVMAAREGRAGKTREALLLVVFGLVFGGVGVALLAGAGVVGRKLRKDAEKQAQHPGQPWLWREDWASGAIASSTQQHLWLLWVFTLFWNAVSSFVWLVIPHELARGNKVALAALLFPLIGVALLAGAIHATLRWRRFGQTRLKLLTLPAQPGGALHGHIEAGARLQPRVGVVLHLRCIRRSRSGSRKKADTTETTIWEDEKILGQNLPEHRPYCTTLPVFFRIPSDAEESSADGDPDRGIVWRLSATADIPGIDFSTDFVVPVFRTCDLPASEMTDPTAPYQLPVEALRSAHRSRIRVENTSAGGCDFVFPAARNPGVAVAVTLFAALFWGITVFLFKSKAMLLGTIVFGLADVFILWIASELWFRSSWVSIRAGVLTVKHNWLVFRRTTTVQTGDVRRFTMRTGMTSGSKGYYDIQIVRHNGRKLTLATVIPSKVETEWLIREMRDALKQ